MGERLFTDTTDFFAIDYGDLIKVGQRLYIVRGHEQERRFGIDDPKFWVKRVDDAETGEKKIIKLCFFESFEVTLGGVRIRCFRNPGKEAGILDLVRNHPSFMQGYSCLDDKGNHVRVLDIVRGPNLFVYVGSLTVGHETYFHRVLPGILEKLLKAFEAIRFLHAQGFRHGDIRNDHLIMERDTQKYVWIDFDYDYDASENPFGLDLFGLGNILLYTLGKGFHSAYAIQGDKITYGDLCDRLEPGDFSILDKWRLMNLKKLYPYIPFSLNDILMHFSKSAEIYYEGVEEIIEDLKRAIPLT